MQPEKGGQLPALTVTISAVVDGRILCGVCQQPAVEYYRFNRGGDIRRCAEHGGEQLRDMLRGRGHELVDLTRERP